MKTYSLDAAVLEICGPDSGMKDPRGWLLRQIRRGRFDAYKIGRHYRMTQEQIDGAINVVSTHAPSRAEPPPERPQGLSFTTTSARRLRNAS